MAIAKVRDMATAQNLTAQATTVISLSGMGAAVGSTNHVFVRVAADNSNTNGAAPGLAVSDSNGHVWNLVFAGAMLQDPGAANAGVATWLFYAHIVEGQMFSTNSITLTWSGAANPPAKAVVIEEWSGIKQTGFITGSGAGGGGVGTAPSADAFPATIGNLVYGFLGIEGPGTDTYTQDTDTVGGAWVGLTSVATTSGTAISNVTTRGAYKIITSTAQQIWNPTITSRDYAVGLIEILAEPGGAPPSSVTESWGSVLI